MRYGLCTEEFKVHTGILGMARGFGENAGDVVAATRHLLKRVSTKWHCPPRWYKGPAPEFLSELSDHIKQLRHRFQKVFYIQKVFSVSVEVVDMIFTDDYSNIRQLCQ